MTGNGMRAGAKALRAMWSITIESLPPENRRHGRCISAATSRKMWMLSASRARDWLMTCPGPLIGRPPRLRAVVLERGAVQPCRHEAGRAGHGHRCRRVPLVLAAGVDVRVRRALDHGNDLHAVAAHRHQL